MKPMTEVKPATVDRLWRVIDPNVAERAILDLACVIHNRAKHLSTDIGSGVISHDEVVLAYSVFEQFGLDGVFEEIAKG